MRSRTWLLALLILLLSAGSTAWATALTVNSKMGAGNRAQPTFYPKSLATTNCVIGDLECPLGGAGGLAEEGDSFTITFNEEVKQSTMCKEWTQGARTPTVSVTFNDGGAANDTITVSSGACSAGGLKFGTIDLGATGYVSGGNVTFSSTTLTINAGSTSFGFRLDGLTGSGSRGTVTSST